MSQDGCRLCGQGARGADGILLVNELLDSLAGTRATWSCVLTTRLVRTMAFAKATGFRRVATTDCSEVFQGLA